MIFSKGTMKKIMLGDKNVSSKQKCLFMIKANLQIMVYMS